MASVLHLNSKTEYEIGVWVKSQKLLVLWLNIIDVFRRSK